MALIKCRECGNQVSTEATACTHCGAPQRQWDSCEIKIVVVRNSGGLTAGRFRWSAEAVGPKGSYTAAQSPPLIAFIRNDTVDASNLSEPEAKKELNILTSKLLDEGWEFLGPPIEV